MPTTPALISNIPFSRTPHCSGREADLADLRRSLLSNVTAGRVQTIWGLAGAGKTQLALDYAHRFAAEYEIIWWLGAEETSNLPVGYAKLATRLGMTVPEGSSLDDIRIALRAELAQRSDWLVVFDNVAGVDDIRAFLPQEHSGHVLITSRYANWDQVGRPR